MLLCYFLTYKKIISKIPNLFKSNEELLIWLCFGLGGGGGGGSFFGPWGRPAVVFVVINRLFFEVSLVPENELKITYNSTLYTK